MAPSVYVCVTITPTKKIQPSEMPSSINDFEFLKRIGSGSFGECWLVRRKADKKNYVIKQINVLGMTPKEQQVSRYSI